MNAACDELSRVEVGMWNGEVGMQPATSSVVSKSEGGITQDYMNIKAQISLIG